MPIVINTTRTTRAAPIIPMFNGTYDGAELRAFADRASAMQAHGLPSRRGNLLRWPDGRLTDLEGKPATEAEPAYTLPTKPLTTLQAAKAAKDEAAQQRQQKAKRKWPPVKS